MAEVGESLGRPARIEGYHAGEITGAIEHPAPRIPRGGHLRLSRLRQPTGVARLYGAALDAAEVTDPFGAVERFDHALALVCSPVPDVGHPARVPAAAVAALAAGDVTVDELPVEHLDRDEDTAARDRKARRAALNQAAAAAMHDAHLALHAAGDELVELFLPAIGRCMASPFDRRLEQVWTSIHKALTALRPWAVPGAVGAFPNDYRYERPDLAHLWRLANSTRPPTTIAKDQAKVKGRSYEREFRTTSTVVPLWVIGEHPEWGAGSYTADQVVKHAAAYYSHPTIEEQLDAIRLDHAGQLGPTTDDDPDAAPRTSLPRRGRASKARVS